MDQNTATRLIENSVRDPILSTREATHGKFSQNAATWDNLMFAIPGDAPIKRPEHRLVLSMLFLKIARACQNPEVKDHWDDIAGYAKLAAEACEE